MSNQKQPLTLEQIKAIKEKEKEKTKAAEKGKTIKK